MAKSNKNKIEAEPITKCDKSGEVVAKCDHLGEVVANCDNLQELIFGLLK